MQWEVRGADRVTGQDQTLVLEADDEASAMRRGARRGLVVEWARPLDPDDSVAGAPAVAEAADPAGNAAVPAHGASDGVGYAYVAPSYRRRRKKSGGGGGAVVAVIAIVVLGGAGWWAWKATRPAETATADVSAASIVASPGASVIGSPAKETPAARMSPVVPKGPPVPSLHVAAAEVLRVHGADPKLAEATYKGRVIAVDGRVETVGTGLFGTPCIGLGGSGGTSSNGQRIQCAFGKDDVATLNAIHAGDTITVVGTYDGVNENDVQIIGCVVSASPATRSATHP